MNAAIESIPGVCEVELVGPGAASRPDLLIEIPHGASSAEHFSDLRARLVSEFPAGLEQFYFVNTDVGAPECAREIARRLVGEDPPERRFLEDAPRGARSRLSSVAILRCLIPRTFVDCNRAMEVSTDEFREQQFTPAFPEYVTAEADVEILSGLYRRYQECARRAYEWICGDGGRALILHTYAPRSVEIHVIDHDIVSALRRAYEPELYETWARRPDVDVISESGDGASLASPELVAALERSYAKIGIDVTRNATYRLHPATMGYRHSIEYPERVVCMEINRALLADPFIPFVEMRIAAEKAARMAEPAAAALLSR
ncbi:MAG: N-formylglutamate amidohydrolase [bacterium]|nr:N-formylglutamate amidohydrolase [bacterium]